MAFKIDGVVVVDAAIEAKGEVQIEQAWQRRGAKVCVVFKQGFFPHFQRDQAGGALAGAVLAAYLHLEDFVSVFPSLDPGVSQESDETFLEGAKAAFNLAFSLGSWRDEVSHAQPQQCALKLALGIAVVVAGTWPEEAQAVGIDGLWQPMGFKGATEVAEVIPSGLGADEAARHIEARMVVDGEQEDLFGGCRPPLVNGTVVLIEFANAGTTKAPVDLFFAQRRRHEMGKVRFDMRFDAGSSAFEIAESVHFIRHELVVWRVLQREEVLEKGAHVFGPSAGATAAAGLGLIGLPVAQVIGPEIIEPGFADAQMFGCGGGIK